MGGADRPAVGQGGRRRDVPSEALVEEDGENAAVFVVRGGVAHRLAVRLGRRPDRTVQVLEGLGRGR
ncbi:MAG: hypothetical protein GY856_03450 [bacterium]|nr:hypothetical protein [bacterium]